MAYFLSPARAAGCAAVVLLLGGCCANNVCDCDDTQADAIELRFSTAATIGFRTEDLDTLTLLRFPRPYNPASKFETVTLFRTPAQAGDSVLLNNNTPFAQAGSTKLNAYRYVVQYLRHVPGSKPVPTTAAVIDSVQLAGALEGDGCCTCYQNTKKAIYLNGSAAATNLHPRVPLVLTKR